MLNRWESAVAILVVFLALELGLYFFYYLPNRASTPGSSPERTVPGPLRTRPLPPVWRAPSPRLASRRRWASGSIRVLAQQDRSARATAFAL